MIKRTVLPLLVIFLSFNAFAFPTFPALNKDGSVVTGVLTAEYDPLNQVFPVPVNLLFSGTTDGTINADGLLGADPTDFSNPFVALSALDGFSTTERWVTTFRDYSGENGGTPPAGIDPTSVVPGHSVRVFQIVADGVVVPTSIIRELTPFVDYVAVAATPYTLAIIPLKPLPELSSFMAVLTNDITDINGNNATPDQTYYLTKRRTPWIDENGNSTYALIPDATAQGLEPQRLLTQAMEAVAASGGVNPDDIILAWTVQTQSVTPVAKLLRSIQQPGDTIVAQTPLSTADIGLFGLADLYAGVITLPYYLGAPSAENPRAPLTDFWTAAPGAYVPPFDQLGFDPTSTHVTVFNPFPVQTGSQTVPLLMTVPNTNSGMSKPAAGWPTVIFGHGFRGNRSTMLFIADTLASLGFAVIAIDGVMHGISPDDPALAPLYIENTPFAPIANERTFDVDYVNNETGAPVPDGIVDGSGAHFVNFASLLTFRDNMRQTINDHSVLALSIPEIDIDGDGLPDLDGSSIHYGSISGGSVIGVAFVALEPSLSTAALSVGMGGVIRGLTNSEFLGPPIKAGLAAIGLQEGTADYELFLTVAQTVIDSADPINWAAEAALNRPLLVHEVIGDRVNPNFVPTAPLSGTEPMMAAMGLTSYSSTISDPAGLRAGGRFLPPASHGSLLDPSTSPATTLEMQAQFGSFFLSNGQIVIVLDESTMVPIPALMGGSSPLQMRSDFGSYGTRVVSPQDLDLMKGRQ